MHAIAVIMYMHAHMYMMSCYYTHYIVRCVHICSKILIDRAHYTSDLTVTYNVMCIQRAQFAINAIT